MSKIREQLDTTPDRPLDVEPTSDLRPYVIFTQLKPDGPFIYAGWLDAADHEMALQLAINHYGRDQACTCIKAAPREFVAGLRENAEAAAEPVGEARDYQIFTQANAGDQHISSIVIHATSAAAALERAKTEIENAAGLHNIWAIPVDELASTEDAKLIWDNVDQSYRLARGYSQDVKQKWQDIREQRALEEYEKDDLKETF
jgi:1,2-phenylacetyl-CoA epoxidase PaaB subunit